MATVAVTTAEIAVETAAVADIAINRAIIYKIKNGEHTATASYVHRFIIPKDRQSISRSLSGKNPYCILCHSSKAFYVL